MTRCTVALLVAVALVTVVGCGGDSEDAADRAAKATATAVPTIDAAAAKRAVERYANYPDGHPVKSSQGVAGIEFEAVVVGVHDNHANDSNIVVEDGIGAHDDHANEAGD